MLAPFKHLLLVLIAIMVCGVSVGLAQSITGSPADLQFEIINATTGQPGSIERLQVQFSSSFLSPILDIQPSESLFDVPAVPIMSKGKYVVTAWSDGVPYHWSMRGRDLLETPVKLHVFETRHGVDDVAIVGLNLLVRKTESLLYLEYMLQIENSAQPQVSLVGSPHVMINLPRGAGKSTLIYGNGPEPQEIQLDGISGGMLALPVPLTSGLNAMRLKTTLEWQNDMNFPLGANVPIQDWSLMVTPENLDIQSFDLQTMDASDLPGYLRFKGPQIPAGSPFSFRIALTPASGEKENLFTKTQEESVENEPKSEKPEKEKDKGFPFVVLTPIFVVILVIIVSKRRQS